MTHYRRNLQYSTATAALLSLTLLFSPGAKAESNAGSAGATLPREVEDPRCLGIDKEPAQAMLMPCCDLTEALAAKRHASSFCRSLNGAWKFNWVPRPEQLPVEFSYVLRLLPVAQDRGSNWSLQQGSEFI